MSMFRVPVRRRLVARSAALGILALLSAALVFTPAYGDTLPERSLLLSTSQAGANGIYQLQFNLPASETLGSIKLEFCANDPLFSNPCVTPGGLDVASATLAAQSGETGFSILPAGTDAHTLVLSRLPAATTATTLSYTFTGVTNPSSTGTCYGRLQTFATADASGPENDHGGLAFSINDAVQVTTTVPPYLLFCAGVTISGLDCATASGNYINLGTLSDQATASASSQLLTATNAPNGFSVSVSGFTMTSGNNVIDALAIPDVARPGVDQFGLNLVANTTPNVGQNPAGPGAAVPAAGYNQPDFYAFHSGDTIASALSADDLRKLTISYIVDIPKGQPIGTYVATLTYTCLANF